MTCLVVHYVAALKTKLNEAGDIEVQGTVKGVWGHDLDKEAEQELWFTSLDDFKPICHMLHRGRYMTAYFACAIKTGQHFLLKKFDKHKMVPAEERGVRRSIAFSELLHHPNLVKCMGQWEAEDAIYVVEEYVGKGDIFNDCISHPEKYTERYVAVSVVRPLLTALDFLHSHSIIHRSVMPENLYMGLDEVLRLGHLTLAVDQLSDRPKSRTALLDYMAPEMLSVKQHNEQELAQLADDEEGQDACQDVGMHIDDAADTPTSGKVNVGLAAVWEHPDYYDEKVDIWQVGCVIHELLCGSMPFEVESKLDSAGLALWADVEQPPGSLAPDCTHFLQQALIKDPKQRPTAQQLLDHPWLARCLAGEPWRNPAELEAARLAAELETVNGWLKHHGKRALAALGGLLRMPVLHQLTARVQPVGQEDWAEAAGQPATFASRHASFISGGGANSELAACKVTSQTPADRSITGGFEDRTAGQ
eukprot:gene6582-6810_t